MSSYLLISLFLIINAATQILFKTVALGPGGSSYMVLLSEPLFYLCGAFFVAQAAIWLAVLRLMPLSRAYPFTSLSVITLLISAVLFFDESITLGNMAGALMIMAGLLIITGDRNEDSAGRMSRP